MKTFQRPNYALYFQNEDRILSELSQQDVLLIKSCMHDTELKAVWIYHPSQRDWIPIEQNQEIFNAPFEFQRNVKPPQPRVPGPPIKPGPPSQAARQQAPARGQAPAQRSAPSPHAASAQRTAPPQFAKQAQLAEPSQTAVPASPGTLARPTAATKPAAAAKPAAPIETAEPSRASAPQPRAESKPMSLPASRQNPSLQVSEETIDPGMAETKISPIPSSTTAGSGPVADVQRFGILAKAAKFPNFQAQVIRLDTNCLHTNQPWPFGKGQSGILKLQYLNQSFTLQGSVDKNSDGKVLVLEPAYDYVFFQDFLHILGVA